MLSPSKRVEKIAANRFTPPACPWKECPSNQPTAGTDFSWSRYGSFKRLGDGRSVQRYRCRVCERTFSQQTFATSYYLKRPELLDCIAKGLVGGQAHRQIARGEHCAASTVTRQAARLGRHAILLHAVMSSHVGSIDEAVVYDHFETFAVSQYFPIGVGTAVGQESRLVYSLDAAPHRRTGNMSPIQKRQREQLERRHGRAPRDSYVQATTAALDFLLSKLPADSTLDLVSDDHRQYPRAIARHPGRSRIRASVYPNPKRGPKGSVRSPEAVQRDLQMATVDHAHQFIRHSSSHHRRETIAYARRHSALLERLFLHVVWLNLVKLWIENDPDSGTRAMRAGAVSGRWGWEQILARRIQPHEVDLPPTWRALYFRHPRYPEHYERKPHALVRAI